MLKLKSVITAVGLSVLAATTWAADITGAPRNALYDAGLALKRGGGDDAAD